MKNVKLILLAIAAILFTTAACEKDENGNRITYFKNKTGEGYVFYKFSNDSIAPIVNAKCGIESYTVEMFSTITRHSDYVYTDNNGKYSVKFVKTINGHNVRGYWTISSPSVEYDDPIPSSGSIHLDFNLIDNSNKIFIDTIFYYIDRR